MDVSPFHIRRYWFGAEDPEDVADTVLLMERDRLEQYKAALDITQNHFRGVFSGLTGLLNGRRLSVVYSIGPAHIADCVTFLAQGFGVQRFLSTGSIGGLATEMGDIVVSNTCATQDGYTFSSFPNDLQLDPVLGHYVELAMQRPLTISDGVRAAIAERFSCDIHMGAMFTVPAVSLEDEDRLCRIRDRGYIALDLETGPFLAACRRNNVQGTCVHWVTDLPIERNFYYQYDGDLNVVEQDKKKKHKQWLNMPSLILPIIDDLLNANT